LQAASPVGRNLAEQLDALRNAIKIATRTTPIVKTDLLTTRTIVEAAVSGVEVEAASAWDRSEGDSIPPEALWALLFNSHALALLSGCIIDQLNGLEVRAVAIGRDRLDAAAGSFESYKLDYWSWSSRTGSSLSSGRCR
jgi:hypothetical protein